MWGFFILSKRYADYSKSRARYWAVLMYPENLRADWQDVIDEELEVPFCYCVHDKDKYTITKDEEDRKKHVHMIIAWNSPTTGKAVQTLVSRLNEQGKNGIMPVQPIANMKQKWAYLIHATDKAKAEHKHQYDESERITGNNFDIGAYIQIAESDIKNMRRELSMMIINNQIVSYSRFYLIVMSMSPEYEDVVSRYSSHFARLCNSVWFEQGGNESRTRSTT